ncbi:hypothetical protein ABDZ32_03090 [Aeromonas veronii]|uniref:hypothetical protein n=1 Tax=Aeromonas veronii TaxID=654 RepID=UPI0031FBF4EB
MGKKQKGKSQRLVKKEANKAAQETAQVEAQVESSEKECTAAPINIASITVDEKYQFRTSMNEDSVDDYKSLILKGVKWKTPMHIGLFNGKHYLLDGFHRYKAYIKAQFKEIPAGQWELKEYSSEEEMQDYTKGTNNTHGLQVTTIDFYSDLNKIYESCDPIYRNKGTLDLKVICEKRFNNTVAETVLYRAYHKVKGEDGKTLFNKHSDLRDADIRHRIDNGTSTVKELAREIGMSPSGIRKILNAGKEKNDPQKLQEEAEQAAKELQEAAEAEEAEEESTLSDMGDEKCALAAPYHSGLPIITSEAEAEAVSPEEESTLSDKGDEKCAPADESLEVEFSTIQLGEPLSQYVDFLKQPFTEKDQRDYQLIYAALLDAGLMAEEARERAWFCLKQYQISEEAGEGYPVDKSQV